MKNNKLMYRPQTKIEKVCRWSLYILMSLFLGVMLYFRWSLYPHLTKQEFVHEVWGNGNWIYLIGIVILFTLLYVRSNWTKFKQMFGSDNDMKKHFDNWDNGVH